VEVELTLDSQGVQAADQKSVKKEIKEILNINVSKIAKQRDLLEGLAKSIFAELRITHRELANMRDNLNIAEFELNNNIIDRKLMDEIDMKSDEFMVEMKKKVDRLNAEEERNRQLALECHKKDELITAERNKNLW
jgi:hypothetical protein